MAANGGRPQCGAYGGFATAAIHAGQEPDPATGAVVPPISLATTFAQVSSSLGPSRVVCLSRQGAMSD